jgi:hypothetical protein
MKQLIHYAITLVLWVVSMVLWANWAFPYLCLLLLAMHFVELLAVGLRTGRKYGLSTGTSLGMCMLFGFSWWLPLQKQMKAETFTNLDFAREG